METSASPDHAQSRVKHKVRRLAIAFGVWLAMTATLAPPAPAADPPVAGVLDLARLAGPEERAAGSDQSFVGASINDEAGTSVAFVGDVNGDRIPDEAIGAPGEFDNRGVVFVVYGTTTPGVVDLGSLGDRGYRIIGPAGSRTGESIAGVGD